MHNNRILVVGTTNDYIKLLSDRFGDRLLFVTDIPEANGRIGFRLNDIDEVICDMANRDAVISALRSHLIEHKLELAGVTCFDCESMMVASYLALTFGLPYPGPEAVTNCRNKYESKRLWHDNKIACPESILVRTAADVIEFQNRLNRPVIIKPLTGTGSEFVHYCESRLDCMRASFRLHKGILSHKNQRLYAAENIEGYNIDPRMVYVAEEYISGREYSCDFVLDNNDLKIIRIARKYPAPDMPVGTIMAYLLPAFLPGGLNLNDFGDQLYRACRAIGLKRAMGMVDFMVHHGQAYLLELTPRPGGDCLPELIEASCGFDILGAALDFAEGHKVRIPLEDQWTTLVGMRLPANSEGIIDSIDDSEIKKDHRVVSSILRRQVGDNIALPPDNYELWNLGTVIFRPTDPHQIETDCREIRNKLRMALRAPLWVKTPSI